MAVADPYAPCPCGSGQKFKWCCQKVEALAERVQRLFESGQLDSAIAALDDGLRKEPGNPWLSGIKTFYQLEQGNAAAAKETLKQILVKQPQHPRAWDLLARIELESEGPAAGAVQLQQALATVAPEQRQTLGRVAQLVADHFVQAGAVFPAIAHLRLAGNLQKELEPLAEAAVRRIERSAVVSVWQKYDHALAAPPPGLAAPAKERFEQALGWSDEGLWSAAAAAFETLSADAAANPAADRNAGLIRLRMGDNAGASAALERAIARMPETEETVDLEALRQQIAPAAGDDLVEYVQLSWPLRNRQMLLDALHADRAVSSEGAVPVDPDDRESPEVERFGLLDRPAIAARSDLRIDEIPRYVGYLGVVQELLLLDAYDDGALDALTDRVRTLAGEAIPQAHPRTRGMDKIPKERLALSWEWLLPEGLEPEVVARLQREQTAGIVNEVWPHTALTALNRRTPLQCAAAGHAVVALRAAVWLLEHSTSDSGAPPDFSALRARLGIGAEPAIDPETVDLAQLHPARFALVPIDRLSDAKRVQLYRQARRFGVADTFEDAARALVERPGAWIPNDLTSLELFTDLAKLAAAHERFDEAYDWIRRGRQADDAALRAVNAAHWDILELRFKARSLPPESWVPDLVVLMQQYQGQTDASQQLLSALMDFGFVSVRPNPEAPGQLYVDTQVLQAVVARYGPRITTASGELGIAATRGGLWTPGSGGGGGGGALWTPGTETPGSSAPGGPSKLIVPGR